MTTGSSLEIELGMFQPKITQQTLPAEGDPSTKGALLWWNGPSWLSNSSNWQEDILTNVESEKGSKVIKQIMNVAVEPGDDELDNPLRKNTLWRTLRVCVLGFEIHPECQKLQHGENWWTNHHK